MGKDDRIMNSCHDDDENDLEEEMAALQGKIYQEVGRIIKSVQYVELNLSNELGLHGFEEMTPGDIIRSVKSNKALPPNVINELEKILKTRSDLVHKYFKRNSFEEQMDVSFLEEELDRLESFNEQVEKFNARFVK